MIISDPTRSNLALYLSDGERFNLALSGQRGPLPVLFARLSPSLSLSFSLSPLDLCVKTIVTGFSLDSD